jgi:hypothetical protein
VLWTLDFGVDQKEVVSPGIPPGVPCSKQSMLMVCRTGKKASRITTINQPTVTTQARVTQYQYLPASKHWKQKGSRATPSPAVHSVKSDQSDGRR